jgi:hypothetical protein
MDLVNSLTLKGDLQSLTNFTPEWMNKNLSQAEVDTLMAAMAKLMAKDLLEMEKDMRKHRHHPKFRKSVYIGVSFFTKDQKWHSRITHQGATENWMPSLFILSSGERAL